MLALRLSRRELIDREGSGIRNQASSWCCIFGARRQGCTALHCTTKDKSSLWRMFLRRMELALLLLCATCRTCYATDVAPRPPSRVCLLTSLSVSFSFRCYYLIVIVVVVHRSNRSRRGQHDLSRFQARKGRKASILHLQD